MKGNIKIESTVGVGTTFEFFVEVGESNKNIQPIRNYDMIELAGKRILILDDNPTNLLILKSQLENWGLFPATASSAKDALSQLALHSFDLVLSDMHMPIMDGVEFANICKASFPNLPIILLSSVGDDLGKESSHLFSAILTKPVKQSLLSRQILWDLKYSKEGKVEFSSKPAGILDENFAGRFPLEILVAEDNEINQILTRKVFNKLGYEVVVVENGAEVLEELTRNQYDMIMMDIQMPLLDGLEATRAIRNGGDLNVVIIAMTANAMQGDRNECLTAGMNDDISKPINIEILVSMLESWAVKIHGNPTRVKWRL
jgi:CheY-like chemotaxis protein